jgi:putative phosphotransacetylase
MEEKTMSYKVPVGLSNKHLHLSQEDLEALFGKGYELTPYKALKQPGRRRGKRDQQE